MKRIVLALALLAGAAALARAADDKPAEDDEALIRKAVAAYVEAFNKANAKGLAALWTPEAVYTSPLTGEQVTGREAIEKQFAGIFADEKGLKLEASTASIRFVSPSVAIEQGTATVVRPKGDPEQSQYSAVYVKRGKEWLLDRVSEEETIEPPTRYEQLKELEWMIGTWVDQDDRNRIETTCSWTKNRTFITRSFTFSIRDQIEMSGMQIIGWDPASKQIRSWVFDSDGGFGEGVWSKKGKQWHVQATSTLPDGRKASGVNIFSIVDKDTFTWQAVNREAGGEVLPNIDEVIVVRESAE